MGILDRLFGRTESTRPEDYQRIFVRWEVDGKVYGPLGFSDIVANQWSSRPLQARFGDESKWFDFGRIIRILERLEASDEQVKKLVSKGKLSTEQPRPRFREAVDILDALATEERAEKATLPATSHMRKKMDSLGIVYHDAVTREEAKALVSKHSKQAAALETIAVLRNRGIEIPDVLLGELSFDGDEYAVSEALDELRYMLDELQETGIKIDIPVVNSLGELQATNQNYSNALMEADNAVDELGERSLVIGYEEYRLVGAFPKRGMSALKQSVFDKSLSGSWNFDEQILALLAEHMPSVSGRAQKSSATPDRVECCDGKTLRTIKT